MMPMPSFPLATIGVPELLIVGVVLFGFVTMCRRKGWGVGSTFLKVLAVGGVVAGVAMFWTRHEARQAHQDVLVEDFPIAMRHDLDIALDDFKDLKFDFDGEPLFRDHAHGPNVQVAPEGWMLTTLGTVLIILGALLFAREKTRPGALKVVTVLGVGALLYSLVTFFGDPPRHVGEDVTVVRIDREPPPPIVHGRAKRPTMRPRRHLEPAEVVLPARTGEINVQAELARTETKPAEAEATENKPAEAKPAETEVPKTEAKPADPAETKPAETPAVEASPVTVAAEASPVVATSGTTRPAWVGVSPALQGGVYAMSLRSGPFVSVPECQRAIDAELVSSVNHYIDLYRGDGASSLVAMPLSYIRKNLLHGEYAEIIDSESVGPMHQLHARLEFDDRARADIDRLWRNAVVEKRLWYTGGGALLVLALLGTFYGYLKLDMKTGGSHKSHLQLAATLVALIVAAGVLVARQVVHF